MTIKKDYMGDGVYANFDGFGIILTTENGAYATNTIYLEPQVMKALLGFAERVAAARKEAPYADVRTE